jgi:hypothetical protein
MSERVMVATGAFATHTTKLYNYYVCPANWNVENLEFIAVNYLRELYYLGRISSTPIRWSFNESTKRVTLPNNPQITTEIRNDLEQFKLLFKGEQHYLFLLSPIIGGCIHNNLQYKSNGAFTQSHKYFNQLGEMLAAHQGLNILPDTSIENNEPPTSVNDYEITDKIKL